MKKFENLGRRLTKEEKRNTLGGNPPEDSEYCCMLYCSEGTTFLGKVSIGNNCGSNPPEVCRQFYPTTTVVACACGQQNW